MMRAYVAILQDSFRESLRSRVLWMLLFAITGLLLLLVPINIREESGYRIADQDLVNRRELAKLFVQQAASGEQPHITRMWKSLDATTREQWQKRYAPASGAERRHGPSNDVNEGLNQLLDEDDLYDATAWEGQEVSTEVTELLERQQAGEEIDTVALNRRLLEAAFPSYVVPSGGTTFYLRYFGLETPFPIATSANQLRLITNFAITTLIGIFVGTAGVFIAVLVTASMVPNTFASGSIDLLLSKPIGRSMLYLTKFVGGCSFILLNAAYFLVGFWLIAGLRIGIWTNRILWCIPIFLFLFAIYYSVSALAGVIWRNTIVCVVVSFLFWLACFVVGTVRETIIEPFFLAPSRVTQLIPAGDQLLATNASGLVAWNDETEAWEPTSDSPSVSKPDRGPPFAIRPDGLRSVICDTTKQRLFALDDDDRLVVANASNGYEIRRGAAIPLGAKRLFLNQDGSLTVVCTYGIFRVDGDLEATSEEGEQLKIGGFALPIRKGKQFRSIGPPIWQGMGIRFSIARSPTSDRMAIHDRGTVTLIDLDEHGVYQPIFQLKLDGEKEAELGLTDETILVARHDGVIRLIDIPSQSVVTECTPYADEKAQQVLAAPDGRWLVVHYSGNLAVVVDAQQQRATPLRVPSQGNVTAIAFVGENDHLLIADQRQRVTDWAITEDLRERIVTPEATTFESVYFWGIDPLYRVFPKPSELNKVVQYVLLKDTLGIGVLSGPLEELEMTRSDIWNPIWSNLMFVTVVLLIGCVYVARKEF